MATGRHVNVARSPLMGGRRQGWWPMESSRASNSCRTKKIAAWPLLATSGWCRSYPTISGEDFTTMTTEKRNFNMNIIDLLTSPYSVCPTLCRIWSTASCTVTNSLLLGILSEKKPAVSSCSTTHADRWPKKEPNESTITETLSDRWVRWGQCDAAKARALSYHYLMIPWMH